MSVRPLSSLRHLVCCPFVPAPFVPARGFPSPDSSLSPVPHSQQSVQVLMNFRAMCLAGLIAITISSAKATAQSASAAAPTSAADGAPPVRKGFFIGGGFGYGSAGIDCDGCSTDRESGPVAYIRLGGTINPHLRIGVESNGWAKTEFGVDEQIGFLTADLYVYPSVSNNFWIKGGVGLATGKESNDFDEAKATGVGIAAGIGYDWNVGGGNFVFVPFATYLRQLSGKIKADGVDTGISANTDVFEIGLGLGFRH